MAEGKEIVIRIINQNGGNNGNGPSNTTDVTGQNQEKASDDYFETSAMISLISRGVSQISNIVIGEAKYEINRYFQLTDDYFGQQDMNIALNVLNKVVDVGSSIYTGATLGYSVGGPIGAVIGGVVGAGISAISTIMDVERNYNKQIIALNKMDAQLQFNRQRAGYSLTAGSIGENR